ncbi:MAG TPA: hypothetical protein VF403_05300 [Kofleriaceae bacterium]
MERIVMLMALALAGCQTAADNNNCPAATPLPCVGTSSCCPTDAPILCGNTCYNTMPSSAECNGAPITVCTDSTAGSPCESGSYCYQWICFGDSECVSTNPNGTVIGANDEGNDPSCTGLLTFGEHFWNIPPAWQSCTLLP